MSEGIRDFKDLIVWQKAMRFAREVYTLTQSFPNEELFVLTAQVRRAVISVPSNIAEGHTRQGRELAHYLSIARGSLAETETQLLLAIGFGYFTEDRFGEVSGLITEIRRMCIALAKKIAAPEC
jgi:four helix bundle protein